MGNFQAALMGVVCDATDQDVWEIAHFPPKKENEISHLLNEVGNRSI